MIRQLWPVVVIEPKYIDGIQIALFPWLRYDVKGEIDEMMVEDIVNRYAVEVKRKLYVYEGDPVDGEFMEHSFKKIMLPVSSEVYTKLGMETVLQERLIDESEVKKTFIFEDEDLAKRIIEEELIETYCI